MIVVAAITLPTLTAHAADSFITTPRNDETFEINEAKQTTIVPVPAWRGALSYWGLTTHGPDWSTLRWLREQAHTASQHSSANAFAVTLAAT